MTDTPRPPRPTYPMRYVFPAEITDLAAAQGLPAETLIRALNMRWLVDGREYAWPAGTGCGMTLAQLLEHGPIVVEWLPQIPEDQRIEAIDAHLSYAVHRRSHLPDNLVPILKIPSIVAENRQPRARASYRIAVIREVVSKNPDLDAAAGETLRTWLTDRLAELDLTVEQAEAMTAHQFPMTRESLEAEKIADPKPSPDDTCADCHHDRDEHDSRDATCAGVIYSPHSKPRERDCECDTFTEVEVTRR